MADGVKFSLQPGSAASRIRPVGLSSIRAGGGIDLSHKGGIEYLARRLEKETGKRKRCAQEVIHKYTLLVQGTARKNLGDDPRRIDEGTLRTSIQTLIGAAFRSAVASIVFTDLEYAAYVHWGTGIHGENPKGGHRNVPWVYFDEKRRRYVVTSGMKPNMFLLNSFNKHAVALERDLRKCLSGQ